MKTISKIYKEHWNRFGLCVDGESVALSTRLKETDLMYAFSLAKWNINNIFKVNIGNKTYPLGHKLWGYNSYEWTTILI